MELYFFFNDTATTEIYTLSLHDALPIFTGTLTNAANISGRGVLKTTGLSNLSGGRVTFSAGLSDVMGPVNNGNGGRRFEEHTSQLHLPPHFVCRFPLYIKKKYRNIALLT